jgi:hypothetical protein
MSYSFLTDVFPKWNHNNQGDVAGTIGNTSLRDMAAGIDIYENFESTPAIQMPKPQSTSLAGVVTVAVAPEDGDLLKESFTDYNLPLETKGGPGPQPFDSEDDYFKILSEDWHRDTARYQAQARSPFQSKDYAEETQIGANRAGSNACMGVAKHLDGCKECKTRLEHIFRKLLGSGKTKNRSDQTTNQLLNVLLMVGIGVFVIFVLDAFVKLGRYLARE